MLESPGWRSCAWEDPIRWSVFKRPFYVSVLEFRNHVENSPGKFGWEEKLCLMESCGVTYSRILLPFSLGKGKQCMTWDSVVQIDHSLVGLSRQALNGLQHCWEGWRNSLAWASRNNAQNHSTGSGCQGAAASAAICLSIANAPCPASPPHLGSLSRPCSHLSGW